MRIKKLKKFLLYFTLGLMVLILGFVVFYRISVRINPPEIKAKSILNTPVYKAKANFWICGNGRLQQNSYGLWELFLTGEPFELGVINGKLTSDLINIQEEAFVNRIYELVPSKSYLNVLKYFIAFFNRNMDDYIPQEYLQEIYGVSLSADDKYDFIGGKYQRILNYHSAHDIGHALQNMNLVGCTAFALWGEKSEDGELLIGRNFDFHAGEAFNKNKILAFVQPDSGYPFMYVTWGGMVGVVSGMNMEGLTITLNAAKSDIPYSAAMPVSLLAREILQYASSIEEAFQIASAQNTFVSESFLIGSGKEKVAVVLEKTPDTTILYKPDSNHLVLTNHFLDDYFARQDLNVENIQNTSTLYRYEKVLELLQDKDSINVDSIASILRNRKGLRGENIGSGNEKAINQLIAHHSIIFAPEKLKLWISVGPFQLGKYLCYDLNKVFKDFPEANDPLVLFEEDQTIESDPFLSSEAYQDFVLYKTDRKKIRNAINERQDTVLDISGFIRLNPNFFEAYEIAGDWSAYKGKNNEAVGFYNTALEMEIPTKYIESSIKERINDLQEKISNK